MLSFEARLVIFVSACLYLKWSIMTEFGIFYRFLNNTAKPATGFAVIPYIQGIAEPIKRILNSHNVKVAQKPFQTLGHIFAKPKDPVTKEQRTDAIYSIPCNDCDNEYIGQTKRQFGTRLKEQQKAVFLCKKENSALSEHTCLTNHTIG